MKLDYQARISSIVSNLYMSGAGDVEYEHARNIWREFNPIQYGLF